MKTEFAYFGGGCFWCTEAIFSSGGGSAFGGKELNGVISVMPGYSGGPSISSGQAPTYEEVSSGRTGHVETIKIEYDSELISYETLLKIFFGTHDPTTLNRQGNDAGTQYRSIVFYSNEEEKRKAEKYIKFLEEQKVYNNPIVTEIKRFEKFYEAEDYHKNYYKYHKDEPYCQVVILPKLEKLHEKYKKYLK